MTGVAVPASSGCSTTSEEETEDGDSALRRAANDLEAEVALLGGSREDLVKLVGIVDGRIGALEAKKKDAKAQAKADVEGYTDAQWERSFFRRDEMELATSARASDIFDRPDVRDMLVAMNRARMGQNPNT